MVNFIKTHQQKIVLLAGYILVAALGFGLGRITALQYSAPEIKIEEAFTAPVNYTSNNGSVQSESITNNQNPPSVGDCSGRIKGNISSGGKIYHMPSGSFYDRTQAEQCFNTEAEAKAAGFRRSTR